MKTKTLYQMALLIAVGVSSLTVRANTELPDSYCEVEYYNCTETIKNVVTQYWQSQVPKLRTNAEFFTGPCYMVNSALAPDHEHYGYVYLRRNSEHVNDYSFFGEFAYFYESNPYSDLTLTELEKRHPSPSEFRPTINDKNWQMTFSEDPPLFYLMRMNFTNGHLLLVGFWGVNDSIVCDLTTTLSK